MSLANIRKDIDVLDGQIRDLLLKRLDYAEQVVQTKIDDGITKIYLAEREEDIIANMENGVPEDRKTEIASFGRKMIEISRMHQYSMLYDQTEGIFDSYIEAADLDMPSNPKSVRFEMIRPNIPGQVAAIFGLISDYRYNVTELKRLDNSADDSESRLWLTVDGNINDINMQKMLLQLAQESYDFSIIDIR